MIKGNWTRNIGKQYIVEFIYLTYSKYTVHIR